MWNTIWNTVSNRCAQGVVDLVRLICVLMNPRAVTSGLKGVPEEGLLFLVDALALIRSFPVNARGNDG